MYLQRWNGWCHVKLLPSRRVLCTPYNHAPCHFMHFMQSYICKVHVRLVVTCHRHFWQNDREILRATAVTREWNGYQNKTQHRKVTLGKNIIPPLLPYLSVTPLQRQGGRIRWSYCAGDGLFIDLTMKYLLLLLLLLSYSVQLQHDEDWHFLVHAGLFCCIHSPPNSDMDYRIFNVRMWSFCTRIHTGDLGL